MVLIDFSHLMHRMLYVAISEARPKKIQGKYRTDDFKDIFVYLIMQQFINIRKRHKEYGEMIICLDNSSEKYWRKDICPLYKAKRSAGREESDINFKEVYDVIGDLLTNLRENFPFQIIDVPAAEADDIIAVLAKRNSTYNLGKTLIYSEDKDFYQMLRYPNIDFYRPVAKEWVTTDKRDMDEWLLAHVCLGDSADGVPRIVNDIYFSENFKRHLMTFGLVDINDKMQLDIRCLDNPELLKNIFDSYSLYKKNTKNENTSELDIYYNKQFSTKILLKQIEKAGSLDAYLDSHPYLRKRYELNKILVLEEYIPEEIQDAILKAANQKEKEYSFSVIEAFFSKYKLHKLQNDIHILLAGYRKKSLMTIEDFGWDV